MRQYQGSLLSSCIHFVLSVPFQFVNVRGLLPALESSLKLGLRFSFFLLFLFLFFKNLLKNEKNEKLYAFS